jgi:predicted RNase H-like HicB family nuclease
VTEDQHTITLSSEDEWYIIHDEETGVTTQGTSKCEALLMLADALAGYEDSNDDLLRMAVDIFVPDPDDAAFLAECDDEDYDPPAVSEEQVRRQRQAALWLTKSHKTTDYSEPHHFSTLRAMIYGTAHGISIEHLREFIEAGYWAVFDAIATGTRTVEEIAEQLDVPEEHVRDAVQTLTQRQLIAESVTGRLYAAQNVVGIGPYPTDDEHLIDWETHYNHTLARTLDDDDLPSSTADGVIVERQRTQYGWYHDPAAYTSSWTDEVVMDREEAEESGANPCPKCFPDTEYGASFDVTELSDGGTRYARKDPTKQTNDKR